MTVEIRELIIHVEVTESAPSAPALPSYDEWNELNWVEKIKQEVIEQLLERGAI